jgi:hypothetical protein
MGLATLPVGQQFGGVALSPREDVFEHRSREAAVERLRGSYADDGLGVTMIGVKMRR